MKPFDVAVQGAGFVGQALALALAQHGFSVALVGQSTASREYTDIRAFALGSAAKGFLEQLGTWPDTPYATPVMAMQVHGDKGGQLAFGASGSPPINCSPLNWIVDVPALTQCLQSAVAGEPRITVLAQDASPQATVHAVCEGKRLDAQTVHYPQHAIAARLDCERPHGNIARQWFNDKGEVLALLPLHGQQVALVWSQASAEAKRQVLTTAAEFANALEAACGKALGAMHLVTERALWPLMLTKPTCWTADNWVLAGDAAHTVHPLAGQGLNLGLGDAVLLATTLQSLKAASPLFQPTASQLGRALRRYARQRQAAASNIQWATDGLHLLFARQGTGVQLLRNTGMNLVNSFGFIKNHLTQKAQ